MSPETAVNSLWSVWYASWVAAAVWSAKVVARMKSGRADPHRLVAGLGCVLLFSPSHVLRRLMGQVHAGGFARRLWTEPPWLAWALFVLTAAGFGFCGLARPHLGRLWSGFVTVKEGHRIVDTGPYDMVRHPIHSGLMFSALATASIRESAAGLAGFALIAAGFAMTARIEEGFLRAQLGAEAYDGYSRRTPMLVPWIG